MNPLVAEYIGLLPVSPVDYVWFDTTKDSGFMNSYGDWWNQNYQKISEDPHEIEKLPMPFDKLAMMVSISGESNLSYVGMMPVLFERQGSTLYVRQYILKLSEPSVEVTMREKIGFPEGDDNTLKMVLGIKIHPELLRRIRQVSGPGDYFEQEVESTKRLMKLMMQKLFMLCYGIPSQGTYTQGYKLTCSARDEQRNAIKRRKGKRQLFEWNTINISAAPLPSKPRNELGGTHASPKPHDRRGHQRRYKSGKVVYIKPMTINKDKIAEEGFIQHDYAFKHKSNPISKPWYEPVVNFINNLFTGKTYDRTNPSLR